MGIKFNKVSLATEQNNYLRKILNVYIVYHLGGWQRNPINNFKFKNCLTGATIVVKNSDKENYMCSCYKTIFDSAGSWSFDNDIARNATFFGVDNSS